MKKYSTKEFDSISRAQQQQWMHELQCKAGLIKEKKTPKCSKALEARLAVPEAKTENSSKESLFADEKLK